MLPELPQEPKIEKHQAATALSIGIVAFFAGIGGMFIEPNAAWAIVIVSGFSLIERALGYTPTIHRALQALLAWLDRRPPA